MKKLLLEYGQVTFWLLVAGFGMSLMYAPPWERSLAAYLRVGSFTASTWILLWLGNNFVAHQVSERFPWIERPLKTFAIAMAGTVVYTIAALYADILFFDVVLGIRFRGDMKELIITSLFVTIMISVFMHGRSFLGSWRAAELSSAQLQKENMRAQYDSLKSQVNPHFLFNSLNALTNLIYEDQDKAARFVKQLSEVYRYVLDTQDREVVPLADEVKFLRSYLFLQQIRYGDKLKVNIEVDSLNAQVPPLVLQMLVENAIKHNVISVEQPLVIRIFADGQRIIVENNVQKKNVLPEDSKGIGLENIRRRYSFLSNGVIEVTNSGQSFAVKLPVL